MLLQSTDLAVQGSLKLHQQITTHLHLLNLIRAIRRSDIAAANLAIDTLKPLASTDPEISFEFECLRFKHELRTVNLESASSILSKLGEDVKADETDVYQRLTVAVLKARMFAHAGTPQKGFTIALKAAVAAQRAGIMPVLWEAVGLFCDTLVAVEEFDAAARLLDAVLPAAHEGGDGELLGKLYDGLADAHVGIMGKERASGRKDQKDKLPGMAKAVLYLDRAEYCECIWKREPRISADHVQSIRRSKTEQR